MFINIVKVHDMRDKQTIIFAIKKGILLCELIEDIFNIKDPIYGGHTPTVLVNKEGQDENYTMRDKDVVKIKLRPRFTF